MTQEKRLLEMLRAAHGPVCSWDLAYRSYMPHASSRVSDLNDKGYVIVGETKDWPDEGHGPHAHYRLVREAPAEQRALITA